MYCKSTVKLIQILLQHSWCSNNSECRLLASHVLCTEYIFCQAKTSVCGSLTLAENRIKVLYCKLNEDKILRPYAVSQRFSEALCLCYWHTGLKAVIQYRALEHVFVFTQVHIQHFFSQCFHQPVSIYWKIYRAGNGGMWVAERGSQWRIRERLSKCCCIVVWQTKMHSVCEKQSFP